MGSIPVDESQHLVEPALKQPGAQTSPHAFSSFEVVGLSSPTATGLETLLLSWLVVLLRRHEDSHIWYEWSYQNQPAQVMRVSAKEVMPSLDCEVVPVAALIAQHIRLSSPGLHTTTSGSVSLLLSTGPLSQTAEAASSDEPVLHLEARLDHHRVDVRPVWNSDGMLPFTIKHHVETLADTVKLCISNPTASIRSLLAPTNHDLDEIWRWNHQLPPTCDFCMHDVISERAQQHPDKEAISSWDGSFTYAQVDQYSTLLAGSLRAESGVELHDFVPVCFEKSRWTIIAVLAVMKAGATMVLMDPTLPLARLQNMAEQVGAKTMVCSRKQQDLSRYIIPDGKHVVVEEETFSGLSPTTSSSELPVVPPSALMYIIFTSGSTGTPKGVKISHRTYSSSAIPRAQAVGYAEDWRVLDFASYAFDVSIDSMLLTLANGGCLCIPSDEDRMNDINGVMRSMRVNYAGITPSMARILDLEVIASLSGLGLGGEAVSARDANFWGQHTRIIIGYGPCECTIGCTVNSSAAKGRDYISIGPGNGAAIWIVDSNDHETLTPVGAVGELFVEGPIVGQGYLNDPDKTAAAFIEDPRWLVAGHGPHLGRRGRLYKTGDLGRYDPDGSGEIVFVGRKDTQVKLRGQRVELGEIESQLRARLPSDTTVIAEVIAPMGSSQDKATTLVAFVTSSRFARRQAKGADLELVELDGELRESISEADAEIAQVLPRYMVPTVYIPVNRIPTLISGKTDRKLLRQFGSKVDLRQLTATQDTVPVDTASDGQSLSEMEQRLREAWATTLKLDESSIRLNDNFFALGGDSLAAMRLVSICREQGLDLSVTSTFANPTLSAMAASISCLSDTQIEGQKERPAFSLAPQPVEAAIQEAAQIFGAEPANIQDMYPCTPTQESLITFSLKSTEPYIAQRVACIPSHISLEAWKQAWDRVIAATPILRSRVVQLRDHPSLFQVVLKEDIQWKHHTGTELSQYLENDRGDRMDLGRSLARYAIVDTPSPEGKRYMVWTIHHVVYDGWSEPLILEKIRDALQHIQNGGAEMSTTLMSDFVHHIRSIDPASTRTFWRDELQGAVGPQFPRVPSRDYLPTPDTILERHVSLPSTTTTGFPFTLATLIRGAWSLVSSHHSGNPDVVFGETLTGRDVPLPGVEGVVGPLIATVPVRVRVATQSKSGSKLSVGDYLRGIQQSMLARAPHQHMGMQHIRRVSADAQYACEAPAGLVIQPEARFGVAGELGFVGGDVVREAIHFNPYPLMVACGIVKGGRFRVCASFDSKVVGVREMERVLAQLETACVELSRDVERELGEVCCLPADELEQIWGWNRDPPLVADPVTGSLRSDAAVVKQGSVYHPRAAVPWVCDLQNPAMLSPIGCPGELCLEGASLSGDTVMEDPAWLVAGSAGCAGRRGRVQPTGDIVKLQEDGSLVFLGRKDNDVAVHGHAADAAELEVQVIKHLPLSVRAAVVAATFQGVSGQKLVVFLERQTSESVTVNIMPEKHSVTISDDSSSPPRSFTTVICNAIPKDLAAALKRLDKFAQNTLASHLVPSAYVVVDELPLQGSQVDRSRLEQLASGIPSHIRNQLRDGLQQAWKEGLPTAPVTATAAEDILRSGWAKILGLAPEQIELDDNFFRLGGDSVLAMKLVSHLRSQGHGLTVADIFRHMRLGNAARVLKMSQFAVPTEQRVAQLHTAYQPFSMLGSLNAEQFVAEVVRPRLADARWTAQDVYPVTDTQALDVRATIQPPRTSIQYTMLYFDKDTMDRARLLRACHNLIEAHDILRTIFIEHETVLFQVVLSNFDIPITIHQTQDEDLERSVHDFCAARTNEPGIFQLGSPFIDVFLVQGQTGQECLAIGLSHALYDGASLPKLLQHLEALYTGKPAPTTTPFSIYLSQTRSSPAHSQAISYWRTLLSGSSLSILPGQTRTPLPSPTSKALFRTRPIPTITTTHNSLIHGGITTATLLTAAWSLLLARRLRTADVTFGSITSGRGGGLEGMEDAMGPCYQFTPVRVPFQRGWRAAELLAYVQRQSAESLAWDFVGVGEVVSGWEGWEVKLHQEGVFFDSVVHHQDWEDFDTMQWGDKGGQCKVDVVNPAGDAAWPMKIVSFVKEGRMYVGVVGRVEDEALVEGVLAELSEVVGELVAGEGTGILLENEVFSEK